MTGFSLGELAEITNTKVVGDPGTKITALSTPQAADASCICFINDARYIPMLSQSAAGAWVVSEELVGQLPTPGLIATNPYQTFAELSQVLHQPRAFQPKIADTATIATSAKIADGVYIGPGACVEADCIIEKGVFLGAGTVVCFGSVIAQESYLHPGVVIGKQVTIGQRCIIHAGQ